MEEGSPSVQTLTTKHRWATFSLDARLTRAIQQLQWNSPTLVQSAAIPLALQGKDILAKAKTGSGKTGAYAIPIVQQLLTEKGGFGIQALILVPTTELVYQVKQTFDDLCSYCPQVTTLGIAGDQPLTSQVPRLAEFPNILIATPGRLAAHLTEKNLDLSESVRMLVIDEADLIISYGYRDDLQKVKQSIPRIYQGFLMSATLSTEVTELKKIILHTPAVLELEDQEKSALRQFYVECPMNDKFLLIYVLLKLKLVTGKTMIFVNDIDNCFRLRLFLERFSIRSAVLNAELPQNSRLHIVQEFNRGALDIVIATDENQDDEPKTKPPQKQELKADSDESMDGSGSGSDVEIDDQFSGDEVEGDFQLSDEVSESSTSEEETTKSKKKSKTPEPQKDKEYAAARGIDFKRIANVINFDFPPTKEKYVHRVGRTARAGEDGLALSLVGPEEAEYLAEVQKHQDSLGGELTSYTFQTKIVEGFRYRVIDQLRSVSKIQVKEARLAEIKREILTSKKLQAHFDENPLDRQSLTHDKELQSHKIKRHLAYVPDYLMPTKQELAETLTPTSLAEKKQDDRFRVAYTVRSLKKKQSKDPLKTYERTNSRKRSMSDASAELNRNKSEDGQPPRKKFKKKHKKAPIRRVSGKKFKSNAIVPF